MNGGEEVIGEGLGYKRGIGVKGKGLKVQRKTGAGER